MKVPRFLWVTGGLLGLALVCAVGLFWYVQTKLTFDSPTLNLGAESKVSKDVSVDHTATATDQVLIGSTTDLTNVPVTEPVGIPLRDLSLTADQTAMLQAFGVEVDKFVVTDTMINCATNAVGVDRMAELKAGAVPAMSEAFKLFGCLRE